MTERIQYKQEKPSWCPHESCGFLRRAEDRFCGGSLPKPEPHGGDLNTHCICFKNEEVVDFQVNMSDLDWFRWVFDAIDGKKTSWLS